MSTRRREYETLREQLITLQKAFQSIVELDEALKGRGANAIKGFYQAQLDVLSLWLQLVDRNIAFFSGIPEGAASRNLENETVELPFLEDELSNSESRAKEMIAEQQEDLQRIFDRISDIQPLQVFSRNDVDQQLDEAKMKREKTIESVEQFDEELTSKYTMMESDEQVLTALFSELMNASSQGNQVSSIYYDAASFHSSDIYSAIAASQAEATGVKKEQTSQEVESAVEENENPFIESVNSFKEIGTDFWAGFQERGDKKMDSLYDFGNYLTSGLFDGVRGAVSAMDERSHKAMDSPYDFVNYLTSGGADLVKGAVNPEDDFSKEHWLSSFGLASMVAGAKVSVPKMGTMKMNSVKHTLHPDIKKGVMKQTYHKVVQNSLSKTRMNINQIRKNVGEDGLPIVSGGETLSNVKEVFKDTNESVVLDAGKREFNINLNDPYIGVKQASEYLKYQGVPREFRKTTIESFERGTIKLDVASSNTYGLRFYDGINASAKGRYLFETFLPQVNRRNLALPPDWNRMTEIQQWKIKPGTIIIKGKAGPQFEMGDQYIGGIEQWYITNLDDLIKP